MRSWYFMTEACDLSLYMLDNSS